MTIRKNLFKQVCLLSVILFSMANIQASCEFNVGAAVSDVAHLGRDGGAGVAAACIFIDNNRNLWGSSGCVSHGYYWDTETGDICFPEDINDVTHGLETYELGEAMWNNHPGFIPGNSSTINWSSDIPPPGMLIGIFQWEQMRQTMLTGGFGGTGFN